MVDINVGKYALNDKEVTRKVNVIANHHTLPSLMAGRKPLEFKALVFPSSFEMPSSSTFLLMANAFSAGVSHPEEVSGKSGSMNTAMIATATVSPPSIKNNHLINLDE